MTKYILNRILIAIPTIIGITILIFLAMRVLPGDPLAIVQSESSGAYVLSEDELQQLRASLGLDQPYYIQYLEWMGQVVRGIWEFLWTNEPISVDCTPRANYGTNCHPGGHLLLADRRAHWNVKRDVAQLGVGLCVAAGDHGLYCNAQLLVGIADYPLHGPDLLVAPAPFDYPILG
ncbi:MAG: hypothetical protein R2867_41890 [Caldilineaceae bacterium]